MVCMGMKGGGDEKIAPPNSNKMFTLTQCEMVLFDHKAYSLYRVIELLHDMAKVQVCYLPWFVL